MKKERREELHPKEWYIPSSTVNFLSVATIGEIAALLGTLLGIQVTARGIGSEPENDKGEEKEG